MKTYLVGGHVRDRLLRQAGLPVPLGDRDWVVVGGSPEELLALGYHPVGADFPVFLHPTSHEEYALARTERKTAPGYHGFVFHASPEVTLEEDLRRRDLTINAMAEDENGRIIDPYGGEDDIRRRVLRHVSPAFAEDPVRVLRVARFAARLPEFSIAPETMDLMRRMVADGETDALVRERVWAEFRKGLLDRDPTRMPRTLAECGFWGRALPDARAPAESAAALARAATAGAGFEVRAAIAFQPLAAGAENARRLLRRLGAGREEIDLAALRAALSPWDQRHWRDPEALCDILSAADVLRRPRRFEGLLALLGHEHPGADLSRAREAVAVWRSEEVAAAVRAAAAQADHAQVAALTRDIRRRAVTEALRSGGR